MADNGSLFLLGLHDEHVRILIAIDEGRMKVNQYGRYVIENEERPDRKAREQLRSRGLAVPRHTGTAWRLTAKGRKALRVELDARMSDRFRKAQT